MRIIGLAGWSGSGKTTLIKKLIPRLIARGLSVSTLKHAHHGFDLDQPGKDSFFHRTAGATEVASRTPIFRTIRACRNSIAPSAALIRQAQRSSPSFTPSPPAEARSVLTKRLLVTRAI